MVLIHVTRVQIPVTAHMKNISQKSWLLLGTSFVISFFLNWLVFRKTGPNFPVIFRSNDFGINFLGHRNLLWQIPVLGIIFVYINYWLSRLFQSSYYEPEANNKVFAKQGSYKNLSRLLFFANIGVAVLILLISVQIYFLNR